MPWESGKYQRALRHIDNANALEIKVGIVRSQQHRHPNGNIDMAYLYSTHEEGEGRTPARPTLRPAIKEFKFRASANEVMKGIITGDYRREMKGVGDDLSKEVKRYMMRLKTPALHPLTIANRIRGGSNPLVDTGQLLRAIDSTVD